MNWWLFTFFIGAVFSLFLPEVPSISLLFLLIFLTLLFFIKKSWRTSSGFVLGALWILFNVYYNQQQIPVHIIESMLAKKTLIVEGEVLNLQATALPLNTAGNKTANNAISNSTKRVNFKVHAINHMPLPSPFIVRLSWQKAQLPIKQGQTFSFSVKLKPAHGLANIGGFNYLTWLKANNIVATGYVINARKPTNKALALNSTSSQVTKEETSLLQQNNHIVESNMSFRQQLFDYFKQSTTNHKLTPILLALAFGERSLLTKEHWEVLQNTGTSHLIAISGLHIGLLASGSFFVVLMIFRLTPFTLFQVSGGKAVNFQSLNIRYLAILVSVLFATSYAYLAGFSLPTQRALVMLLLYWVSRLLGINFSVSRLLLITLLLVLLVSPFSLLSASFWLSFSAVAIIFLSLWRFSFWINRGSSLLRFVKGLLVIQISLTIFLIPVSAIFFSQLSTVSLWANFIAVPWMSFITIPCTLLAVCFSVLSLCTESFLARFPDYLVTAMSNDSSSNIFQSLSLHLSNISMWSIELLWQYLTFLTEQDGSLITVSFNQQLILVFIAILLLYLIFACTWLARIKAVTSSMSVTVSNTNVQNLKVKRRAVISICVLLLGGGVLGVFQLSASKAGLTKLKAAQVNTDEQKVPWQVTFFDVGQGLSALITRDNQAILYDTGASYPRGFTLTEAVVLPYLQHQGMNILDKVIISHSDNDHAGGIKYLHDNIKIEQLITNDGNLINLPITRCAQGQVMQWQGLTLSFLWPLKSEPVKSPEVSERADSLIADKAHKPHQKNKTRQQSKSKQNNDDSCVVLISDNKGNRVLLTGDITKKVEQQLIALYPELTARVIQVPHHGSKTSSSLPFIKHISPEVAIVSAGYLNRWKMPVDEVKQRYKQESISLVNTADSGQINITFSDNKINLQTYTQNLRPFWFSH